MKLTDTQLVLLSKAAQRDDRALEVPPSLTGGAVQAVAASLLKRGLAVEAQAKGDMPIWRRDADAPIALTLTEGGLHAIGLDGGADQHVADPHAAAEGEDRSGDAAASNDAENRRLDDHGAAVASPRPPREGTKLELLLALLERIEGATLDDLVEASGWLPHTTRAALTGLRKRGYTIKTVREKDKRTIYCIGASAPAVGSGGPDVAVEIGGLDRAADVVAGEAAVPPESMAQPGGS